MSRFAAVRETAVYYWKQEARCRKQKEQDACKTGNNPDLYEYYKAQLPDKAAVWGIGYCAPPEKREEAARLLVSLVNSDNAKAARTAVLSLAGLYPGRECPEDIRVLFYKCISDPRGRVSRAALDVFRRERLIMGSEDIYNDIIAALGSGRENAHLTAKRLAMALCAQPVTGSAKFSWVLRLCVCDCEEVRQIALRWTAEQLMRGHIFSGIGDSQRQEILAAAEEVFPKENGLLPRGTEEFIKFSLTGKVDQSGINLSEYMYSLGRVL